MSFSNIYETKLLNSLFTGVNPNMPTGVSFGLLKKIAGGSPVEDGNLTELAANNNYARAIATNVGLNPRWSAPQFALHTSYAQSIQYLLDTAATETNSIARGNAQESFDFLTAQYFNESQLDVNGLILADNGTTLGWTAPSAAAGVITKTSGSFDWSSINYAAIIAQSLSEWSAYDTAVNTEMGEQVSSGPYPNSASTWSFTYDAGVITDVKNAATIPFNDAQGGVWEEAVAIGLYENLTNTLMLWAAFTTPIIILDGQKLVFEPNDLTIQLD